MDPEKNKTIFNNFIDTIISMHSSTFAENILAINDWTESLSKNELKDILCQIGTIPESIEHDSTEEKLFAKVTDSILARSFREIGLKSTVLTERADSADVFIESKYHNYTMVADAKSFRLSRTARNQKDYKILSLSSWRKDCDYALLCAPYFQYPKQQSQIYQQSLSDNVALFSWEQMFILVNNDIKETPFLNLNSLWNWSKIQSTKTFASDMKKCFLRQQLHDFANYINLSNEQIINAMNNQIKLLKKRGKIELKFLNDEIEAIKTLTKEQAINELIIAKKIPNKIKIVKTYLSKLSYE